MKTFLLLMKNSQSSFSRIPKTGNILTSSAIAPRYFLQETLNHTRGVKTMLSQGNTVESQATDAEKIRENVRERYAKVARENTMGTDSGITTSCCGAPTEADISYSQQLGYSAEEAKSVPEGANLGLGCGNPHAIAQIQAGNTVLDLGSGAGFDCFLAARRVGDKGRVIGVDMTSDMIEKARTNARKGNYHQVEFRQGQIESLPVEDNTIDVIISNCVVNLSTNKPQVYQEAARVLKPGGRIAISDVVATGEIPEHIKKDFELYSGCMAGATPLAELEKMLQEAGLGNIKIMVKEESRTFIKGWAPNSGAENYVAAATIEASKPSPALENKTTDTATSSVLRFSTSTTGQGAPGASASCCDSLKPYKAK